MKTIIKGAKDLVKGDLALIILVLLGFRGLIELVFGYSPKEDQ